MVKSSSFKNQVNAVGGAAFLIIGGFFGYELLRSRESPPCGSRYPVTTQLSLQKPDGNPLAPGELQARMGSAETGILEKASVVKADSGSAPFNLNVKVGGPIDADTGAGFIWAPGDVPKATTACLSYQVYVPTDFDYARGGRLPGLFGIGKSGAQAGFATRFTWDERGIMGLDAHLSDVGTPSSPPATHYATTMPLPLGRWVQIDQEVALNQPNTPNGALRVWIDGRLRLEDSGIAWRGNGLLTLSGAIAEIGYVSVGGIERPAKKQSSIMMTPLRLAWR